MNPGSSLQLVRSTTGVSSLKSAKLLDYLLQQMPPVQGYKFWQDWHVTNLLHNL